jgi:hypothetical protein
VVVIVVAMNKKGEEPKTAEVKKPTEDLTDNHEGQVKSLLTGEWVEEAIGENRAIAVMTENTKEALPQYGLNSAGVIYEAPVEGSITRLMAIYEDYRDLERIGNVRSCRPYYAYFAAEFDAIYVHFGQSVHGEQVLNTGIVDNLSGLDGSINDTFYRTSDRSAPHNAYTSGDGIAYGIETKGYSTSYKEGFDGHYLFAEDEEENTLSQGEDCNYIEVYYYYNHPYFVYDEATKTYARFQFGSEEVDANDDQQITVSNIIFQNVASSLYDGDGGYLNLTVSGYGEGKYFTRGKMIDITWAKEDDGITHYYDTDGNEIVLNQGKTWVCIIEKQYADDNRFLVSVEDQ